MMSPHMTETHAPNKSIYNRQHMPLPKGVFEMLVCIYRCGRPCVMSFSFSEQDEVWLDV